MDEKKVGLAILKVIESFRDIDINREQREALMGLAVELDMDTIVEKALEEQCNKSRRH